MHIKPLFILLFLCSFPALFAAKNFPIIAYTTPIESEKVPYKYLTHINYSFSKANPDGTITNPPRPDLLKQIVKKARKNRVKVGLAIGGWNGGDDSAFEKLAAKPESRQKFAKECLRLVKEFRLDGIDIDWEYPDPGQSAKNCTELIKEIAKVLKPKKKFLSIAIVAKGRQGEGVEAEVFKYVDYVNIMSYDGGEHSTFAQAETSLDYWLKRGVSKKKAIIGVPFYSRGKKVKAYKDIIKENPEAKDFDLFEGMKYNGKKMIARKTKLAKEKAGGIMFWQLSQDAPGKDSLVKVIYQTVNK